MVTHPAMSSSGDACSYDTPRAPLSPVTGGDAEDTPLITRIVILWDTNLYAGYIFHNILIIVSV